MTEYLGRRCFIGSMLQLEVFYYFIFIIFLVLMWTLHNEVERIIEKGLAERLNKSCNRYEYVDLRYL
ncbi:MAG: hypothetical protein QW803_11960 [Candidatus Methanomethylicia archaeon]